MKTENFDYEVRRATPEDIPAIVETSKIYWRISSHGVNNDHDFEKIPALLKDFNSRPGNRVLVAMREGVCIGYYIFYTHDDYKTRPEGELYQFFVHPDYWGTTVARDLVELAVQTFDDWGCSASYVCLSSEIDEKSLVHARNLFAKFGYVETGIVMTRRKVNGITEG